MDQDWYFEEQTETKSWIEILKKKQTNASYKVSRNETDYWGLVLILEKIDSDNFWIKLAEGIACIWDAVYLECKTTPIEGYWDKKQGRFLL